MGQIGFQNPAIEIQIVRLAWIVCVARSTEDCSSKLLHRAFVTPFLAITCDHYV